MKKTNRFFFQFPCVFVTRFQLSVGYVLCWLYAYHFLFQYISFLFVFVCSFSYYSFKGFRLIIYWFAGRFLSCWRNKHILSNVFEGEYCFEF